MNEHTQRVGRRALAVRQLHSNRILCGRAPRVAAVPQRKNAASSDNACGNIVGVCATRAAGTGAGRAASAHARGGSGLNLEP